MGLGPVTPKHGIQAIGQMADSHLPPAFPPQAMKGFSDFLYTVIGAKECHTGLAHQFITTGLWSFVLYSHLCAKYRLGWGDGSARKVFAV